MLYEYKCVCGKTFEAERPVDDRYDVSCPACGGEEIEIQLQPIRGSMKHEDRMISEAQCEAEYGPDWRETDGSRRMAADEPERLYSIPKPK